MVAFSEKEVLFIFNKKPRFFILKNLGFDILSNENDYSITTFL